MIGDDGRPSAAQMHAYLRARANDCLRRPGMYGGEVAHHLLFDALAFADGQQERWRVAHGGLRERGRSGSTGVGAVFLRLLPGEMRHDDAVASVYAELAHEFRWLDTDRVLNDDEYLDLVAALPSWVAEDRTASDVRDRFGPPSCLLGGNNPRCPKTLLYVASGADQVACFHLWNDWSASAGEEPLLLVARLGGGRLDSSLRFTPEGARRRPAA
ncbi:hypothetical protein [Micromonospora coxensis]|uniref:hypothetical protein n=1 Tax=Micromonospora coxensis TaxID=356852 RepID=UPI00343A961F